MPDEPHQASPEPSPRTTGPRAAALLRWGMPLLAVVLLAGFAVSRMSHSWQEGPSPAAEKKTDPAHRATLADLRTRIDALRSSTRQAEQSKPEPGPAGDRKPPSAGRREPVFTQADAAGFHKRLDDVELTPGDPDTAVRLAAIARELAEREAAFADAKRATDRDQAAQAAALAEIPKLKESISRQQAEIADLSKQLADAKAGGKPDAAKEIERLNEQLHEMDEAHTRTAKAIKDLFCDQPWRLLFTKFKDRADINQQVADLRKFAAKSDTMSPEFKATWPPFMQDRFGLNEVTAKVAATAIGLEPIAFVDEVRAYWFAKLRE